MAIIEIRVNGMLSAVAQMATRRKPNSDEVLVTYEYRNFEVNFSASGNVPAENMLFESRLSAVLQDVARQENEHRPE